MTDTAYDVAIQKDLTHLIPRYLENRKNDVGLLRSALARGDLAQVRYLGHRLKGIGASYGFAPISAFGKRIEQCITAGDTADITVLFDAFEDYLAKVRVTFI
jgi:HPt (histidine-containing phosphotransfer) domain-containing protein